MKNRREVLLTGAALAVAATLPSRAGAEEAKPLSSVSRALGQCVETGNACLQHCLRLLGQGDKSLAECANSVREMLAVCNAMGVLVTSNSPRLKAAAALCSDICADCEKACRVHADHHAECKACAEACAKVIVEMRKLSA